MAGENATLLDVLLVPQARYNKEWLETEKGKIEEKKHEGCTFKP